MPTEDRRLAIARRELSLQRLLTAFIVSGLRMALACAAAVLGGS